MTIPLRVLIVEDSEADAELMLGNLAFADAPPDPVNQTNDSSSPAARAPR